MEADWANLGEPLSLILHKLVELADHFRFTAVCKNWCSIAKLYYGNCQLRNIMPMLLIPTQGIEFREKKILYEISSKRVYHCQLPVSYDKRCCGSSHGWLATVDRCHVITLTNPFKNADAAIRLPPIDDIVHTWWLAYREMYEYNIHKVILSANPTTNPCDYVVVAIYGAVRQLAFIKAGQKFWTYVHDDYSWFTDVTFYKGLVYAVGEVNKIFSFDLSYLYGSEKKIIPKVVAKYEYDDIDVRRYLVKSLERDLWLVKRSDYNDYGYREGIKSFGVYKMELDDRSGKLLQMLKLDSLGDNILFVGESDSTSVSASCFSKYLQRDSIYYIDDFFGYKAIPSPNRRSFYTGIYNIKDGNFSEHYSYEPSFEDRLSPIWVIPPFQWD